MTDPAVTESEDWLNLLDFDAIPDPFDKVQECQYFLGLIERETNPQQFRWIISAFFGAAYSFFEIAALFAYESFWHPKTGEPIANEEALAVLRRYVVVIQDAKRPSFIKTAGKHSITKELYRLRRGNTHHCPLSIMSTPDGFQFGNLAGKGTPAHAFCGEVMTLIKNVHQELRQHF